MMWLLKVYFKIHFEWQVIQQNKQYAHSTSQSPCMLFDLWGRHSKARPQIFCIVSSMIRKI